jgi:hypothetical protein
LFFFSFLADTDADAWDTADMSNCSQRLRLRFEYASLRHRSRESSDLGSDSGGWLPDLSDVPVDERELARSLVHGVLLMSSLSLAVG